MMRRILQAIFLLGLFAALALGAPGPPTGLEIGGDTTPSFPGQPSGLTVDLPDVTLSIPNLVAGEFENASVEWTATCENARKNIASVQLYADGVAVGTADTSAPYEGTWITGYTSDQIRDLTARCVTSTSETAESVEQSVYVDVTAPVYSNMVAVAVDATTIETAWGVVENGSGVSFTTIGYCTPSPCTPTGQLTSSSLTRVVTGLTYSASYDFATWASDAVGNLSASSNKVTASLSDLVAYLEYEDNVTDLTGLNTWTAQGNGTYVAGKFNQAYFPDGTGDYITAPSISQYNITDSLTVEIWPNCNSVCAVQDHLIAADDVTNRRWGIRLDTVSPGSVEGFIVGGNTIRLAESSTNWSTGNVFTSVFLTFDGSNVRLYIGGDLVATTAYTGTIDQDDMGAVAIAVGARNNGTQPYTGLIDRTRIFKRVISSDGIKFLHNKGLAQTSGLYNKSIEQYAKPYPGQGYEWANNTLGKKPSIPYLFSAVSRSGQNLQAWGREYLYSNSILPTNITSSGISLFQSAPTVTVTSGGQTIGAGTATYAVLSDREDQVKIRTSIDSTNIAMHAVSTLEVDGFLRVDLDIVPKGPTRIDDIKITLPFVEAVADRFAKELAYNYDDQSADPEDIINAAGYIDASPITFPFSPQVWIGNDTIGLEFVTQTNVDMHVSNTDTINTITPGSGVNTYVVNLIDGPFLLTNKLTYSFALLPTPVRPMPTNWRKWYIHATGAPISGAITTANSVSDNWDFIYPGTFTVVDLEYAGLPIPEQGTEADFFDNVAALRAAGVRFAPYSALYAMANNVQELGSWRAYWESAPARTGPWSSKVGYNPAVQPVAAWHKSLQDFLLATYSNVIGKYGLGGTYLDFGGMLEVGGMVPKFFPTANPAEKVFYPVFGAREYAKRLWTMTHELDEDFWIAAHTNRLTFWQCTWMTACAGGEAYNRLFQAPGATVTSGQWTNSSMYTPDYSTLPYILYPQEYSQGAGFVNVLLPQVRKNFSTYLDANPSIDEGWTRTMLGPALVNDIQMFRTLFYVPLRIGITQAIDKYGALDDSNTRIPMTRLVNDVEVSGFRKTGRIILFVHNYDDATNSFTLNKSDIPGLSSLSWANLIDAETDADITETATTAVLSLTAKNFKVIVGDLN